jgi:hypothetical protein
MRPKPKLEVVEELDSDLLAEDSGELSAPSPEERISSSSLVEDLEDDASQPFALVPSAPKAPAFAVAQPEEGVPAHLQAPHLTSADEMPREFVANVAAKAPPDTSRTGPTMPPGSRAPSPRRRQLEITTGPAFTPRPLARSGAQMDSYGPATQPPWLIPALVVGGIAASVVAVSVLVLVGRWVFSQFTPTPAVVSSAVAPSASTPTAAAASAVPSSLPVHHGSRGAPCVLAGAPHVINPHAMLRQGVEVASTPDRLALGFALDEHKGLVVGLDPSTMAATATAHDRTTDTLRRVVPVLTPGVDLGIFLETTHSHGALEDAHPVSADPPFYLGVAHHKLAWARSIAAASRGLWDVDGDTPVEAMHVVPLEGGGYAIAFRQAAAVYLGALQADLSPNGALSKVMGLGPQIGAPSLAAGAHDVLVAWPDRPGPTSPWGIRWLHWKPGNEPEPPTAFPVPAGGGGGPTHGSSLGALEGGRFVIVWTEGRGTSHEVRAEALDQMGEPVGSALTVSAEGVNAGGGMPILTPDGRGAVVFLATPAGAAASVVAVPIVCPPG